MGELRTLRDSLKSAMALAIPARKVTRDLRDFADRDEGDLLDGIFTILGQGEKDYAQYLGRLAQLGTLPIIVIGQVKVAETAVPSAIEDAEDLMAEDLKAFCRTGLPGYHLSMLSFRQSGQLEHPYGWIAAELEILT